MSPFRGLFGGGARTALPTRASLSNADKEGWLIKQVCFEKKLFQVFFQRICVSCFLLGY